MKGAGHVTMFLNIIYQSLYSFHLDKDWDIDRISKWEKIIILKYTYAIIKDYTLRITMGSTV